MAEEHEERLNVYDALGRVVGAEPRHAAKASGLAVGAVNALVVGPGGVLLQRRPADKENGGLWDKTVGGHVSAGEDFDTTLRREAGEELFDDARSPKVQLVADAAALERAAAEGALARGVVVYRAGLKLGLRDVRHAPGRAGIRNVVYHVAVYLGRSELPLEAFRPQASEIEALRYVPVAELDRLLLDGALAPNMAFVWLAYGRALVGLAGA